MAAFFRGYGTRLLVPVRELDDLFDRQTLDYTDTRADNNCN
jgi:hypothetical protein